MWECGKVRMYECGDVPTSVLFYFRMFGFMQESGSFWFGFVTKKVLTSHDASTSNTYFTLISVFFVLQSLISTTSIVTTS